MRRSLPAWVLVFMAPLVAELLSGSTPLGQPLVLAILLPIYLLLYGAGALLIREVVRRTARGWASILLLGAAYGLIEEGFASQSLFNPTLYHAAEWGARVFGINGVFTGAMLVIHAVWSAAIPILLTELLFPEQRTKPYLKRFGLIVTSLCYVLGVALLWAIARVSYAAGYEAPPLLPTLALVAAFTLVVVALRVLPRKTREPARQSHAPHPWMVFLFIGISVLIGQGCMFLWHIQPLFADWPPVLVPMLSIVVIAIGVAWLVNRWSRMQNWNDAHLLALASGAVISHIIIGMFAVRTTPDLIGLIVLGLAMVGFLTWLAVRVRRRDVPHESAMKETEETLSVRISS